MRRIEAEMPHGIAVESRLRTPAAPKNTAASIQVYSPLRTTNYALRTTNYQFSYPSVALKNIFAVFLRMKMLVCSAEAV